MGKSLKNLLILTLFVLASGSALWAGPGGDDVPPYVQQSDSVFQQPIDPFAPEPEESQGWPIEVVVAVITTVGALATAVVGGLLKMRKAKGE